jgi:hypothetical protein
MKHKIVLFQKDFGMDLGTFSPKLWSMLDLQMQQKFIKEIKRNTEFKNLSCCFFCFDLSVTLTFDVGVQVLSYLCQVFSKSLNYEEVLDRT